VIYPNITGNTLPKEITTYYVRNAQGSVMATYEKKHYNNNTEELFLQEQYLYGSSRLGMRQTNLLLAKTGENVDIDPAKSGRVLGEKLFELTGHTGNVLAVVSDKRLANNEPDVVSASDFYPFGMQMSGRAYKSDVYKYGFTGHEKVDEITGASGTVYLTETRLLDTRLGIWRGVDELSRKYPSLSPYAYCANNPLIFKDTDGRKLQTAIDNLPLITGTLTAQEAQYVSLDNDGYISLENLQRGMQKLGQVGGNYSALLTIVQSDKVVEFSAPMGVSACNVLGETVNNSDMAFPFNDPSFYDGEYELVSIGIALTPFSHNWTENDKLQKQKLLPSQQYHSNNDNYQVQMNGRGKQHTFKTLVEGTAHELYGHTLFMLQGKDALHYYEEGRDANEELARQYRDRVEEASRNYDEQNR
jgi:RHS repeat-associated protein